MKQPTVQDEQTNGEVEFETQSYIGGEIAEFRRDGERPPKSAFAEAAHWSYANYAFASTFDIILDNTKARKYGFQEFVDSEEMLIRIFDNFRQQRFIP